MKNIIKLTCCLLVIVSCKSVEPSNNNNPDFSYPETILPEDDTKLWLADGDESNQIVTIFLQGGPSDELNFEKRKKTVWRYLPDYNNYYRIHLHQANTVNTTMFTYDCNFSMKMARREVENTSEILYRAIKYFKDKGKTVWVIGHSYGAYIIPNYLATRPSLADKYYIVSGRLNDPRETKSAHKNGYNGTYKNGITFISDQKTMDFSEDTIWGLKYYIAKQKLKAAIGEISYTKALKNVDLSNVTYIYAPKDERVGGLTKKEIDFLRSKNVKVFESEREHGHTWKDLIDLVKEGKIKL